MSAKNVHTQLVGRIQVEGGYLDAMLCMDRDRPDEAMIHFWSNQANSTTKPGAFLFNGIVRSDGRIDLSSNLRYSIDSAGALIVAPAAEQTPPGSLKASIWPKSKSKFTGTWIAADGIQRSIEFDPTPTGPKIKPRRCRTWNDFKIWGSRVSANNHIGLFRGHCSNEFTLSTSLHRTGATRLERFAAEMLPTFTAHAETVLNRRIDLNDPRDYSSSMALAQHHGLPTPLMDWTVSPYIAAFFAFSDALETGSSRPDVTHVRIYGVTDLRRIL